MNDFDIITPDPVYGARVQFDEDGNVVRQPREDFSLTSEEEICFRCPLPECVEEAKEGCVIELRANDKRIESYLKQKENGKITVAGEKKLSTLQKQAEIGWKKFRLGVAKKLGSTSLEDE